MMIKNGNSRKKLILKKFEIEIKAHLGSRRKKIILFGSKARGDDSPEPDYDCLAVVDKVTPEVREAIDELAGELLFEHNAVFSIFPVAEKVFQNRRFDPFLNSIRKEGIVL